MMVCRVAVCDMVDRVVSSGLLCLSMKSGVLGLLFYLVCCDVLCCAVLCRVAVVVVWTNAFLWRWSCVASCVVR